MSLNIADAVDSVIRSRRSVRRFSSKPVDENLVLQILDVARNAPSNSNTQPWRVYVVAGQVRETLSAAIHDAHHRRPGDFTPAYPHFPTALGAPFVARQDAFAAAYYESLGIERSDQVARHAQSGRNFLFFDAPIGLFFTIDSSLERASWLDCGIFLQSVMLAAKARGIDTCPQISFSKYHAILREHLPIAANETFICGMSMGYADPKATVNRLSIEREPMDVVASLFGFDDKSPERKSARHLSDYMNKQEALIQRSSNFLDEVKDLTAGTELERWLNANYGPASGLYRDLAELVKAGVEEGWAANAQVNGRQYRRSRICEPCAQTSYFSITAVYMNSMDAGATDKDAALRGDYHAHPYGELNMVIPLNDGAVLAGPNGWSGAGWTAPAPGSHHYPEVRGGAVIALFFLPAGRISYGVQPPA